MMLRCVVLLSAATMVVMITMCAGQDNFYEKSLVRTLLADYDTSVRPKRDPNEPIDVFVTFHLTSISDVNEKGQTISIVGWTTIEWPDDYLTWSPAVYGNISMIVIPVSKIWIPDLVFENSVGNRFYDIDPFRPRIYSDGNIAWEPGGPIDLFCRFILVRYPFDKQTCKVKLVTWANSGSKVLTYAVDLDLSYFEKNDEWTVINSWTVNSTFSLDNETYSEIYFYFTIRRLPLYHIMNILLPVILLSILNILVFCLPPESGEKVSLSLTVLLAFSVWLLMMNEIMPSTSDNVPVIGIYITVFMCISSLSVLITVIVIRTYERRDHYQMPKWAITLHNMWKNKCSRNSNADGVKKDARPGRPEFNGKISWKSIALTIDRMAFYVFSFIIIVLTIAVISDMILTPNKNDPSL